MRVLVTGATGYVGGRLVPLLADLDHDVVCLARDPGRLRDVPWADRVRVEAGDVLDPDSLAAPFAGVDVAYYLIHSIGSGPEFSDVDRRAATSFAEAAAAAGVQRIIYLGGIVPPADEVASPHLASRAEVGQILLDAPVPAVVLQAGVVIGSGSASFEMLRYLTERLPVMVTPRWVNSRVAPIAIRDVLSSLVGALDLPPGTNRRYDIAGPEVLTYLEMMRRYAKVAGLRPRLVVTVPVLSPRLSSHWVNLVTPVPKAIAQPLIESLRNSVVPTEDDLAQFLGIDPLGYDEAVALALQRVREGSVATRWAGASWPGAPSDPLPSDPDWSGGDVEVDERSRHVDASPAELWRVVEGIGGERGWYSFPLAWAIRGLLDRLVGGVGLRRGRRHPDLLQVGEPLDFWRVEALERGQLLRLRAEMRLPGRAWLEFRVEPAGDGAVLHQRAIFRPRGLAGRAYWLAVTPFHGIVFEGMLRNMTGAATRSTMVR
ncbi:MAG TPA: SDR family oxidoreductase [Acidimicrobiales bacterium]|nr:SDR family oxidoreductase [Acidimicrobiales bacterium]